MLVRFTMIFIAFWYISCLLIPLLDFSSTRWRDNRPGCNTSVKHSLFGTRLTFVSLIGFITLTIFY